MTEPNLVLDTNGDPSEVTDIELVMCGYCEKKITPNLIASFGADHHDPDQVHCEDCFNGAIDHANAVING